MPHDFTDDAAICRYSPFSVAHRTLHGLMAGTSSHQGRTSGLNSTSISRLHHELFEGKAVDGDIVDSLMISAISDMGDLVTCTISFEYKPLRDRVRSRNKFLGSGHEPSWTLSLAWREERGPKHRLARLYKNSALSYAPGKKSLAPS